MKRASLSRQHLLELTQALVYVVYINEKAKYVGATTKGIIRPFSNNHHVLSKIDKQDISSLELILCDSAEEAFRLEKVLINKLDPDLNATNPRIKRENRRKEKVQAAKKDDWTQQYDAQTILDEFIKSVVDSRR